MTTRRQFIANGTAIGAAAGLGLLPGSLLASSQKKAEKPLNILFLGGTGFLGPHTVNYALSRGHKVTLFNRGRSSEGLFPDLETIKGNRDPKVDEGLKGLEGRKWDAVIDTSGYVPRIVGASAELLSNAAEQYVFISSISVYANLAKPGIDETSPVGTLEDPTVENIDGMTYGPLKAYSEQAAMKHFGDNTTIIRPGLIVGPRDRTDRYTYWPVRVARGGEVLAPGDGKDIVQYIDARDLGAFIVKCIEQKSTGIYNATSPANETMFEMLESCKKASWSDAKMTWVPADFLAQHGVQPWAHMPVWVPNDGEMGGISQVSVERASKAGMQIRDRVITATDTLKYFTELPEARRQQMRAGVTALKEQEVLEAWKTNKA